MRGGEFVCTVGPPGDGKTTVLRCLGGLQRPSVGAVKFHGAQIVRPPRELALVFQDYSRSLLPWGSVVDNVALPLRSGGMRKRGAAMAALPEVGLGRDIRDEPGLRQSGFVRAGTASDEVPPRT